MRQTVFRRNATGHPARPVRIADAIGLALNHDLSAKYVDACLVRFERLATPQMTGQSLSNDP